MLWRGTLRIRIALALSLLLPLVHGAAEPSGGFSLAVERVGSTSSVLVVGSWTADSVSGWSWGLCHDSTEAAIDACGGQSQLNDPCGGSGCPAVRCPVDIRSPGPQGQAPSFHSVNIYEDGITQGVLLDIAAGWSLPARDRFEMLQVSYVLSAAAARLEFCDHLGTPPIRTVFGVVSEPVPFSPVTTGVTLTTGLFVRGNADGAGGLGIGDAIFVLSFMFQNGTAPPCMDAADTNDNGLIDIGDAIGILSYLFAGGPPPADPASACGGDPTPDELDCVLFPPCAG